MPSLQVTLSLPSDDPSVWNSAHQVVRILALWRQNHPSKANIRTTQQLGVRARRPLDERICEGGQNKGTKT